MRMMRRVVEVVDNTERVASEHLAPAGGRVVAPGLRVGVWARLSCGHMATSWRGASIGALRRCHACERDGVGLCSCGHELTDHADGSEAHLGPDYMVAGECGWGCGCVRDPAVPS